MTGKDSDWGYSLDVQLGCTAVAIGFETFNGDVSDWNVEIYHVNSRLKLEDRNFRKTKNGTGPAGG